MSYHITTYNSIEEMDPDLWAEAGNTLNVSMSYDYLRLIERLHKDEVRFHYTTVTQQDGFAGLLCFQTVKFRSSYLNNFLRADEHSNGIMRFIVILLGKILNFMSWDVLLSGNIFFTGESGIHFEPFVNDADAVDLIEKSFVAVCKRHPKKVSAYMMNNVYDDDRLYLKSFLKKFKYASYPVDPDMFMRVNGNWKTFEEYQSDISSKYRTRMKKVLKTSKAVEMKRLSLEEIEEHAGHLYDLYLHTADKAALNLGYLSTDYFVEMKRQFRDDFQVLAYFEQDRIVGFMSMLIVDEDLDINYMGLDYEANMRYKLYNRMLYDLVRFAIETGSDCMHLGRTATEIKSTVGARPRKMHIYLNSPSSFISRGMRFFEPYFGSPEYLIRHPFKGAIV